MVRTTHSKRLGQGSQHQLVATTGLRLMAANNFDNVALRSTVYEGPGGTTCAQLSGTQPLGFVVWADDAQLESLLGSSSSGPSTRTSGPSRSESPTTPTSQSRHESRIIYVHPLLQTVLPRSGRLQLTGQLGHLRQQTHHCGFEVLQSLIG